MQAEEVQQLLQALGLRETVDSEDVPFTQLSNLTGTPAMSVPLHWTADDLPLGVQFMGPFGSEDRLLQVARQLEEAQPWVDRMAPLARGWRRLGGCLLAAGDLE
jgi:Asp-tRNA(Asn)/Glu-tRNA(Gln) amidotransferase A subunit family amidase